MTDESVNVDLRRWVNTWLENALEWLYPATCRLCLAPGRASLDLCPDCLADLPRLEGQCERCAKPLPAASALCGACLRRPPAFDAVTAALAYAYPADWLVHDFKFRGRLGSGRLLAELLVTAAAERDAPLPELLLPVPLHASRLAARGFNQSLELARLAGGRLGIPVATRQLIRTRPTPPQHELPASSRAGNVRNAFGLRDPLTARHVAVIDDVMTTGHTVGEIARILKQAGAEYVEIWVAARA